MYPIIYKFGPLTIYSYGLMLVLAFIISAGLARRQAVKEGINPDIIFNFAFIVFISGIIGGRIFYLLENFGYYLEKPLEIFMLWQGGLSWFGGLFLGTVCGIIYLKTRRLSLYKILDLVSPFVALAGGIGRLGCFLNGCCFGKISKFGIYFPLRQATLIPTQLYSALALFLIFLILRNLGNRAHRQGEIFYAYLLLYAVKRFLIEFWRGDNPPVWLGLSLFQIISIGVFCLALVKLILISKNKCRNIS